MTLVMVQMVVAARLRSRLALQARRRQSAGRATRRTASSVNVGTASSLDICRSVGSRRQSAFIFLQQQLIPSIYTLTRHPFDYFIHSFFSVMHQHDKHTYIQTYNT